MLRREGALLRVVVKVLRLDGWWLVLLALRRVLVVVGHGGQLVPRGELRKREKSMGVSCGGSDDPR